MQMQTKAIVLTVGLLFAGLPSRVPACQRVAPFTFEELFEASIIVRVTAVGYGLAPSGPSRTTGMPNSTVEFRINEVLRGEEKRATLELPAYLTSTDDYNDVEVPYHFVRPGGRRGSCFANEYREGGEFLLFLKPVNGELTPYWSPLGPTNEQLRGEDDPWVVWVRGYLEKHRGS